MNNLNCECEKHLDLLIIQNFLLKKDILNWFEEEKCNYLFSSNNFYYKNKKISKTHFVYISNKQCSVVDYYQWTNDYKFFLDYEEINKNLIKVSNNLLENLIFL